MSDPRKSIDLFERIKNGEVDAQTEVFDQYVLRLLGLVRSRLSGQFARRIDPEDVVQSAYRSFFKGVDNDRFVLENSGDLWRLLAAIAVHKLQRQIERNQAAKRSVKRENSVNLQLGDSQCELPIDGIADEPSAEDAAALNEEVELLTQGFSEQQVRMFELRLAGSSIDEIAAELECSERTVRRFFDQKVKPMLQERLVG